MSEKERMRRLCAQRVAHVEDRHEAQIDSRFPDCTVADENRGRTSTGNSWVLASKMLGEQAEPVLGTEHLVYDEHAAARRAMVLTHADEKSGIDSPVLGELLDTVFR
jgi:hypothetical protein